jgi:gas vesicle protein
MSSTEKGHVTLSGFLVGAAVGTVVGAGVALLLAPKSGKDTREWLGHKTREAKGKLGEAYDRAKDTVRRDAQVIANALDTPRH